MDFFMDIDMANTTPMMACGHSANATTGPDNTPCCVICAGDPKSVQIIKAPSLTNRLAKCGSCDNKTESSTGLAFFEYKGEGSNESITKCVCGYHRIAHLPYWTVHIKVVRRWFKIKRYEDVHAKTFHASEEQKELGAEREAQIFRRMMEPNHDEETRVKSVEILKIFPTNSNMRCNNFRPIGTQKYDQYYCGCHGWD